MKHRSLFAGLVIASLTATAWAHSGATGIVKERMDAMKDMGEAIKRLKPIMSGDAPYDAATVREAARIIRAQGGTAMTEKFPEGSTEHPSEARAEIWRDWPEFEALARQMAEAAHGLELAAENGLRPTGQGLDHMGGMMGHQADMMGGALASPHMTAEHIGRMPADRAFVMVTQLCSACHDQFRKEN